MTLYLLYIHILIFNVPYNVYYLHFFLPATTTPSKIVTTPTIPTASVTSTAGVNMAASTAIPANPSSTAVPAINAPNNG